MAHFQIYISSGKLYSENPIIEAETGRKALDKYLKENKLSTKVKVSGDSIVDYQVTPIKIIDGKKYHDSKKRVLWYKII